MKRESDRNSAILDFCAGGKTTIEVCNRFDIAPTTAHRVFSELQSLGLLEKKPARKATRGGTSCIFTKVGTSTIFERKFNQPIAPVVDEAFIRAAHNPFCITQR